MLKYDIYGIGEVQKLFLTGNKERMTVGTYDYMDK